MESLAFLFIVFISIVGFFMFMYFVPVGLWITAIFAGVKITIGELIGMRIRKVPPGVIVNSLITATKAGLQVTTRELETHYLAGGDVPNVIRADPWPATFGFHEVFHAFVIAAATVHVVAMAGWVLPAG